MPAQYYKFTFSISRCRIEKTKGLVPVDRIFVSNRTPIAIVQDAVVPTIHDSDILNNNDLSHATLHDFLSSSFVVVLSHASTVVVATKLHGQHIGINFGLER